MNEIGVQASVDGDVLIGDWTSARWFGAKLGRFTARLWGEGSVTTMPTKKHRLSGVVAQAFARDIKGDGLVCGFGVGQVGHGHLLYIGIDNGAPRVCVGFVWLTRPA